ncbi:alkaline phosphatase family protein [Halobellus ordinarius]|uniref:alkaline phosphatase family protein n=1 Tax=Halobellus ordinarius TaxID=3075120 RepID=UPI0028802699|nr:alkaline phosphatase family protein [Halobellus sp. ZY16]
MDLLIIGLDGLSYNMLDRFDIELDYFDRVRERGISGDLMSVDTPTTFPAWTSFATGKDPGSHGVCDMMAQDADYSTRSVKTTTDDPAICDFFDDGIFINLPASADRIPQGNNTHVVSAFDAKDKTTAVPDELKSLDAYDDYVLSHNPKLKTSPKRYLQHVLDISEARGQFATEAFETYDPDVGFVLFSTPDWAGHILGTLNNEAQRRDFYTELLTHVDQWAEKLSAFADNVVLMSDHGFEQKHTTIHIADWLRDEGYLVEKQSEGLPSASEVAVDIAMAVAKRSDLLYSAMRRVHNRILGLDWGTSLQTATRPDPDYTRSTAWQLRYATIYLNDDRFDSPTVEDPEPLREEICDGLRTLTDGNGNAVFRDVLLPEEAYNEPGPHAPDVLARPAPGHHPLRAWSPQGGVTSPTTSFEHRYNGIFVGDGPLFRDGTAEDLNIVDVLPTVMAALGQPISPDFDGEARTDLLEEPVDPSVLDSDELPPVHLRTDDDADREAVVEERLSDLGYME